MCEVLLVAQTTRAGCTKWWHGDGAAGSLQMATEHGTTVESVEY